uniref:Uncharacterized protein n=1 Tax=viral metagenome TaxID=1070528 RepID=A0A6C0D2Y8_9ZZZZ
MSCPYKNALGVPGQGNHFHVFGIAIVDVIMTIVGGALLAYIFKWSYLWTILILFILGIILHRLFCVKTTVDILFFGS